MDVTHVVMFSGGVGSWAAASRVVSKHGPEHVVLLFADTLIEDEDLYRFVDDAVEQLGCSFVRIADGRDPWQVFTDVKLLGNTHHDPCSRVLKRDLLRRHIKSTYDPETTVIYLGIDWTEVHRLVSIKTRWGVWDVRAPMCEAPYMDKCDMLEALEASGIKRPRLYRLGFPHNNCGGFCVKAGQAHFRLLLNTMPDRYAYHEAMEAEWRKQSGHDYAILRDRTGGNTKPLTLEALRKRVEDNDNNVDLFEWGGCGCTI